LPHFAKRPKSSLKNTLPIKMNWLNLAAGFPLILPPVRLLAITASRYACLLLPKEKVNPGLQG